MTINCKGYLLDFDRPKIMGILNITPDSFYDGGKFKTDTAFLRQAERMLADGAAFIDIGGQSTRPKAEYLSEEQESKRVLPIIKRILQEFPKTFISVDTFHSSVAKKAVRQGACMINDISAGNLDEKMIETVGNLQVPYIMMHMRGTPETMQSKTDYKDLLGDILYYFSGKIKEARQFGINDIIIDPGFGFSKTVSQNFELLRKTDLFKMLELPVLMGVSRKSTICKSLNTTPENALNGTTVLNTLALQKKVNILRVHDVRAAWECIELVRRFKA